MELSMYLMNLMLLIEATRMGGVVKKNKNTNSTGEVHVKWVSIHERLVGPSSTTNSKPRGKPSHCLLRQTYMYIVCQSSKKQSHHRYPALTTRDL